MPIVTADKFLASRLDYLVIGGGTSGLTLAARLTEDSDCIVGVLEAGEYHEHDPEINIPGMRGLALGNPQFDWCFSTLPQKYLNDRVLPQNRGKGLGGSSGINFYLSLRPAEEELDAIEQLGNPGWNWNNLFYYMKKSECLHAFEDTSEQAVSYGVDMDPTLSGHNGPVSKAFPVHVTQLHSKMMDALDNLGVHRNPGHASGQPLGAFLVPTTVDPRTATRSYSASAYYAPNSERPNLLVLTGALATKIHLEAGPNGLQRATGVSFVKDGTTVTVNVVKEVILSAGSFQSPQVLELSGIGDKNRLKKFDIGCHVDLPGVGENLQDHGIVVTIVEVDPKTETLEILANPALVQAQQELYTQQKGILAGVPTSCVAFVPARVLWSKEDIQNFMSLSNLDGAPGTFSSTHPAVIRGIEKQYEIMRKWISEGDVSLTQLVHWNGHLPVPGFAPGEDKRYITMVCGYSHPLSRGSVHINTSDPSVPPEIQPNYLSNPADLDVLTKGVKFLRNMYRTKPLSDSILSTVLPPFPDDVDDEVVRGYVRATMGPLWHPVGTVAMLPREDGGVVDNNLLVYGISNLRVVDCSVIPLQISSNTVTMAYAIGEKAADIIKSIGTQK